MTPIPKQNIPLFNAITRTEEALSQLRDDLIEAQRRAEELYLDEGSSTPRDPD